MTIRVSQAGFFVATEGPIRLSQAGFFVATEGPVWISQAGVLVAHEVDVVSQLENSDAAVQFGLGG